MSFVEMGTDDWLVGRSKRWLGYERRMHAALGAATGKVKRALYLRPPKQKQENTRLAYYVRRKAKYLNLMRINPVISMRTEGRLAPEPNSAKRDRC